MHVYIYIWNVIIIIKLNGKDTNFFNFFKKGKFNPTAVRARREIYELRVSLAGGQDLVRHPRERRLNDDVRGLKGPHYRSCKSSC